MLMKKITITWYEPPSYLNLSTNRKKTWFFLSSWSPLEKLNGENELIDKYKFLLRKDTDLI